jgi:hypothetical protein
MEPRKDDGGAIGRHEPTPHDGRGYHAGETWFSRQIAMFNTVAKAIQAR